MIEINMVDAIGEPAMYEQLAEECNKLGKAALKLARVLRGENPTPMTEKAARAKVIEEFTDVAQITGELDLIIDVDQQDRKRRRFWERWRKRTIQESLKYPMRLGKVKQQDLLSILTMPM